MCETLEKAAEDVGNLLMAAIFNLEIDEGKHKALLFEFSGPDVIDLVAARLSPMGVRLEPFKDKRSDFIRAVLIEDLLRAKMSIMVECAVKRARYRELKKDVDFVCHGLNWRAPDGTPDDKLTTRQVVYKHSYGDEERNAKAARVSDPLLLRRFFCTLTFFRCHLQAVQAASQPPTTSCDAETD